MAVIPVELHEVVEALIDANQTDLTKWPAAAREGGELFRRIRKIESDCITQHGAWDMQFLEEATLDEYDSLRSQLNQLRDSLDPQAPRLSVHEMRAQLGLPPLD